MGAGWNSPWNTRWYTKRNAKDTKLLYEAKESTPVHVVFEPIQVVPYYSHGTFIHSIMQADRIDSPRPQRNFQSRTLVTGTHRRSCCLAVLSADSPW